jgi:FKBP-type peptidyl-prolyl cis-trans isomerase FkpA
MRKGSWILGIALSLPALNGCAAAEQPAAPKLETDQDKTFYAMGLVLGQNIKSFQLTPEELKLVNAGLEDAVLGRPAKVDLQAYQQQLRTLSQERAQKAMVVEKEAAKAFIDQLAKEPGAERTESGLVYIPITPGTGERPAATDRVKVHYHGTLRDGSVFDSSKDRGQPATFALNGVIKCWTEGVQKMQVGGKSKLVCPSDIAYGDRGQPPKIMGGATLVFEVELLEIEKPAAPPAP